ncbi:uncharacterized protein LOC118563653 [Fundulus heteroclitus]|uniref:uncharacterized protein LOC118563653 n=1 Tax=Fundulus heteroclitus TaxID=8078 RepID=UPI00165C3498|nr:uncharacterized protein LOC118563653 [Fundulus heteroclitus]
MASTLDIPNPDLLGDPPQLLPVPEEPSCTSCQGLLSQNQQLTKDLLDLRKKLSYHIRWSNRARRVIKQLQESLQQTSSGPVETEDVDAPLDEGSEECLDEAEQEEMESKPGPRAAKAPTPTLFYPVEYLDEYWVHLKGSCGTKKHLENQKSKVRRIMLFLAFITEGQTMQQNWMFLPNIRRIYQWPDYLLNEGKAVTTIKAYLVNTSEFLSYFKDTPPPASRVPKASLFAVIRAISSSISKLGRRVVIRQIRIKKRKMSRAISRQNLHTCQVTARARIPEIIDNLSADPSPENRRRFFGYASVYLASLYGHRTGVLRNMTASEVDEAQKEAKLGDDGFVINVKEHKTNRAFGPAQLYLTVEFAWFEQWLIIRERLNPSTDLLFFTENNTKIDKLLTHMQAAWIRYGSTRVPDFY